MQSLAPERGVDIGAPGHHVGVKPGNARNFPGFSRSRLRDRTVELLQTVDKKTVPAPLTRREAKTYNKEKEEQNSNSADATSL